MPGHCLVGLKVESASRATCELSLAPSLPLPLGHYQCIQCATLPQWGSCDLLKGCACQAVLCLPAAAAGAGVEGAAEAWQEASQARHCCSHDHNAAAGLGAHAHMREHVQLHL